jgi:NFU1 iron-sulfur cluster scaffold homolog, mitochondrial
MIPMHATATANPRQLRWAIPPDRLPPGGIVREAPGRLGALLNARVIEQMVVRSADVLITLGTAHDWRELGDDVRQALSDALPDLAGWRVDPSPDGNAELTAIAEELLAGPIGALAESHGGSIELVSVVGDNVTVRMSGACHGCPAAASTLYDTLQRELRRRAGQNVTVCTENDSSAKPLGRKLLSLLIR